MSHLKLDRRIREHNARLPLDDRRRAAEAMGYSDGLPLTEDDLRHLIRDFRDSREMSRASVMRALCPPEDPADRRLGSLTPAEFGALFAQEWPAKATL
ncbi:MAG TPA: hypothetical protein VNF47_04600 [Streptosporangiaceae bacterium]|nr:hypothetical protein [Streptosporangiaceae bacterium]